MTVSEGRPLDGRTVVVTRSRAQAAALADALAGLGAEVLAFPTIAIADPEDFEPLDSAIRNLEVYHWVVFTSANAVERFFARLHALGHDARSLATAKVAAVGPGTAKRCEEAGVTPDFIPEDHRGEGVLDGLCIRGVGPGSRVLIPRALEAREVLPDTLRERGAVVDVAPTYRTVLGPGDPAVLARLSAHEIDAVTFTSASTVRNFVTLTATDGGAALLDGVVVASIGPITSDAARALGLKVDVEASPYTVPGLVQALAEHLGR
jgi:uroporphyrinogen III methyltransferase/synthase